MIDWETPNDLFDMLNQEFKFDLDVCADNENKKVLNYINKKQNALKVSWKGVCWMNPPYNNKIGKWIHKAYNESQKGNTVVCLLQSRSTDTAAWHDCIMRASEIRYVKGRLHFGLKGKFERSTFGSVVVVFRPYCQGPPVISSIGGNGKFLNKGEGIMDNQELGLMQKPDQSTGIVAIEEKRAIQEVQASMIIAKRFGRDQNQAFLRITRACERIGLAQEAMYQYPRGGITITGPSIRLAEVLAQNWGNIQFGIRELSQVKTADGGYSEVEAFAWDVETNTKEIKTFQVPHVRYSRAKGFTRLTDPRDIYEMVANQGARRLRACILGIIPGDIIDAAVKQCEETLKAGDGRPFEDRLREMLVKFDKFGVTQGMIENRLGHKIDATTPTEIVPLQKIYNSIRDGMTTRADWFIVPETESSKESQLLTEKLKEEIEQTIKDPGKTKSVKDQIDDKNAEVTEQAKKDAQFRSEWIKLKKNFIDFVTENLDRFKEASPALQAEAKAKWLRHIELGIQENVPWPLDVQTAVDIQVDYDSIEEITNWDSFDVLAEFDEFKNFRMAYENLGHDVYIEALKKLEIGKIETTEDCYRVTKVMESIADFQF